MTRRTVVAKSVPKNDPRRKEILDKTKGLLKMLPAMEHVLNGVVKNMSKQDAMGEENVHQILEEVQAAYLDVVRGTRVMAQLASKLMAMPKLRVMDSPED